MVQQLPFQRETVVQFHYDLSVSKLALYCALGNNVPDLHTSGVH